MQGGKSLRLIYKINTKQLKKNNWNLRLPLDVAIRDYPETVVSISDSQLLRFIDELNGLTDVDGKIRSIQNRIKYEKRKPRSRETKAMIRSLYDKLYEIQFQPDYITVVMNSEKDYDRANKGFIINGIKFRRFLGTNGGIKNSTIVYVNEQLYPELKRRMDNGRNMDTPLVPAKLEAYQALICSGSVPVPKPRGIIVVKDCITHFKEDVIMLDDEQSDEPIMSTIHNFEFENDDSDGYGLMLPSYAQKVNEFLTHGQNSKPLAGMNTRYAWNKGMLYSFDYLEFAEQIAGTYLIKDVWGDVRDVRDADVILTESMLKLWECYDSWEHYYENCEQNHYEFSVTKVCPDELENVRNTNYQFLQSYKFTDEEIQELCQPSIDEIKDTLGMDYRKSLVFLCGYGLTEQIIKNGGIDAPTKALMIEPQLINDPFIRRKIWNMIAKRVEMCKRGAIKINANFGIISGDPFALCQSMFGLEITGILKAGEVYHKYWIDRCADEIACFRAPMTCHNNIVKLKLNKSDEAQHWYQYIDTAVILNAWDSTRNSLNGADCDGDLFMTTDNPIILKNTLYTPTIVCVQRKANKIVVNEEDIISANKIGFTDEIGIVTNHITSMFEVQAGFPVDSEEYKALSYRIMCGQLFQQNVIDSIKGIIAKPMPEYWYNLRDNFIKDEDSEETKRFKEFNRKIAAYRKPYFMTYVYPSLRKRNNNHSKNNNLGVALRFGAYGINSVDDLVNYEPKTNEMIECLSGYDEIIGKNPCTINKICWLFEREFDKLLSKNCEQSEFDYTILKSDIEYSQHNYKEVFNIYQHYKLRLDEINNKATTDRMDTLDLSQRKYMLIQDFKRQCDVVCTNEKELCNILADICYTRETNKNFFWETIGDVAIDNLLEKHNGELSFPVCVQSDGEFEYGGSQFVMQTVTMDNEEDEEDDYIK